MRSIALFTAAVVLAAAPAIAAPRTFNVEMDKHTVNDVTFTSRAAIVRMIGRTDKISGQAKFDLNDVAKATGKVAVDMLSVDTGIPLRNEHMRNFIETDKFPEAYFTFTSIKVPGNKLEANKLVSGTANGFLTIHGVTRSLEAPIELTYLPEQDAKYRPGDWIHFYSKFTAKVADHGIKLPPVMGPKVANELAFEIDGMAKAAN
jgi:polyisoprenoid-binding protein YceI